MDIQEIIDLLKKTRRWILDEGGVVCPHKYGLCKHDNENCPVFCIDQALILLKQQPPVGEWTKEIRSFVKMYDNEIPKRSEITFLKESCDIIDRVEAINKIKDKRIAEFETMVKAGGECCDILQERIDVLSEGKAKKEGEK